MVNKWASFVAIPPSRQGLSRYSGRGGPEHRVQVGRPGGKCGLGGGFGAAALAVMLALRLALVRRREKFFA